MWRHLWILPSDRRQATPPSTSSSNPITVVTGVLGVALLLFNLSTLTSLADDAYISFRYLDNLLAGHGLVYNPGEWVEGYTNFLWILSMAPFRMMGLAPEPIAILLAVASLLIVLWAVRGTSTALSGSSRSGTAALLLALGSVPLARWTMAGMETVFFAALLSLANLKLAQNRRHTTTTSVFFGLASLTRPEGVLLGSAAFLAAAPWKRSSRSRTLLPWGKAAAVFVAFPLAHVFFRLVYYGLPLPNTYYAKLSGDLPSLVPGGLDYLWRFMMQGGGIMAVLALISLRKARSHDWVYLSLLAQVLLQLGFTVRAGGDYFPFHRFVVPAIPALAVLAGLGLEGVTRRLGTHGRWAQALPVAALLLAFLGAVSAHFSVDRNGFDRVVTVRQERERVAAWVNANLPRDTLLAVNAAGLIPYRTMMPTIDMLGLNDSHIARAPVGQGGDGITMVGHFKHDGEYVCSKQPGLVLTVSGGLHRGRDSREASAQAALNSFPGDREFLRAEACRNSYAPVTAELAPGRFMVAYRRLATPLDESPEVPVTAEQWFDSGVQLMSRARLEEAIDAFEQSLALNPGNPAAMSNLGYCLYDLQRYESASAIFEQTLGINSRSFDALFGLAMTNERLGQRQRAITLWQRYLAEAPESTWKERARERLRLLEVRSP